MHILNKKNIEFDYNLSVSYISDDVMTKEFYLCQKKALKESEYFLLLLC